MKLTRCEIEIIDEIYNKKNYNYFETFLYKKFKSSAYKELKLNIEKLREIENYSNFIKDEKLDIVKKIKTEKYDGNLYIGNPKNILNDVEEIEEEVKDHFLQVINVIFLV